MIEHKNRPYADKPCPKCGKRLEIRWACCSWKKNGWLTILRCEGKECRYREGYARRPGRELKEKEKADGS